MDMKTKSAAEIIEGLEAEGMKFLGTISRKTTPSEHAQVDLWDEAARRRNGMLTQVHMGDNVYCFETPDVYSGPRTKRAYAPVAAVA
jgi:hypothetical protein